MDGYLAIILEDESQKKLLAFVPPIHPRIFAHHVTLAFRPSREVYEGWASMIGVRVMLHVIAHVHDEKGQAVVVTSDVLKDGVYHITISTAEGIAPVYSNTLLEKGYGPIADGPELFGTIEFVEHTR